MARLHIRTLKCVKLHDPLAPDEPKLTINGSTVAGPLSMRKGAETTLNAFWDFTSAVTVVLVEEDAGPDDVLGSVTITESQIGDGVLEAVFNDKTHADYHMTYDVHSD
jgi:hypothetical protein